MWFLDLDPDALRSYKTWGDVRPVGWLERGMAYAQGPIDEEVLERLQRVVDSGCWARVSYGYHTCDLCNDPHATCGTEIAVPGRGTTYVCPALITHYISKHHYLPPPEFCQAVLNCPEPRSTAFDNALKANAIAFAQGTDRERKAAYSRLKPQGSRSRRRWLFVTVVLVLLSLCTWWYWPRGDARFVGTWQLKIEGIDQPLMIVTFDSNGWTTWGTGSGRNTKIWRVEDSYLLMGADLYSFWYPLATQVKKTRSWLGHRFLLDAERHPIRSVSADSIRLVGQPPGTPDFIFTRIPE